MSNGLTEHFRDMFKEDENTAIQAAKLLTEKDSSLPLKTEISDPLRLAIFDMLSDYLKNRGMEKSSEFLTRLSAKFLVFMVSFKRKSRQEVIEFVKGIVEKEKSITERLTERR